MNAIASTTSVRKAYDATASLSTFWAKAYADTASDIASGSSVRDIADAWKAAKITPANKDSVGTWRKPIASRSMETPTPPLLAPCLGKVPFLPLMLSLAGHARHAASPTFDRFSLILRTRQTRATKTTPTRSRRR
jgi:hypothetical protein